MTASDSLSQGQFYHGTASKFFPGDELTPEGAAAHGQNFKTSGNYVYFSGEHSVAKGFAYDAWRRKGYEPGENARVYEVQPASEHETDPMYKAQGDSYRTAAPVRVIRRVWSAQPEAGE